MKSSEILREAARRVESGGVGLFLAIFVKPRDYSAEERAESYVSRFADARIHKTALLPSDHRATILCLAAAIAESEGD